MSRETLASNLLIASESPTFVYALGPGGTNRFWFNVETAGNERISKDQCVAVTAYIVKAVNSHAALVEALRSVRLDAVGIGGGENAISDRSRELVTAALRSAGETP